jgi:hypothetical protein
MLSITIQAHPHRREMAEALASAVGASVTWDPQPDGRPSAWRTYRHALETAPTASQWHLIVQDDAQPCRFFSEVSSHACEVLDDGILCLFVPGARYDHQRAMDQACWEDRTITLIPTGTWVPVVATAWPVARIPEILEWIDLQRWPESFTCDDAIAGWVAEALQIPVYATVPSLVDHPDDVISIVGSGRVPRYGADANRVAHCYVGDDADPRDIIWTLGV